MIIAAGILFIVLYLCFSMRQDFYHAWCRLIPAAAAFHLALWSMPEVSGVLNAGAEECGLRLLTPFGNSAALLLTGILVLIAVRIAVVMIAPDSEPEFPAWFDRPASFAARAATAFFLALLVIQCALALPEAGTFPGFRSTAKHADAAALFGSRVLNRLSGQSSFDAKQRKALQELREFSLREAERIAANAKAAREAEEAAKQEREGSGESSGGVAEKPAPTGAELRQGGDAPASSPGALLDRTKSRLRTIYDNHNRTLAPASGDGRVPKAETPQPQR